MKIASIRYWKEDLELIKPYEIAYKSVNSVENGFLELTLENGIIGLGSSNPSPYVVGESLDDTMRMLESGALDWLVGKDVRHLGTILNKLHEELDASPGVRVLADVALHDAFTSFMGIPLVDFLGRKIDKLATSVTIGICGVDETVEEGREYVGNGFRILKVKLGNDVDEDIARILKLREVLGQEVAIRVDANQGYEADDLREFYRQTKSQGVELIEQPMKADNVEGAKKIEDEIKDLIAADESLISPRDAFYLAANPRMGGIFNIKLMKCGGVLPAMRIATIASASGIDLMWGCNDESIVSITAALHAAFASSSTRYIDLDGSLDLAKDVVSGGFKLKDGYMSPLNKPGLGLVRL